MILGIKKCNKCGEEKEESCFYFLKSKGRRMGKCITCYAKDREPVRKKYASLNKERIKERMKKYQKENPDKRRAYYYKNREKLNAANKASYEKNRDINIQKRKEWYQKNKEIHAIARDKYYEANKDKLRAARRKWENNRLKTDIEYALQKRLRARIREAVHGIYKKSKRTETLIGCDIQTFKKYLEDQFKEGMSWDNWGSDGWHIDHKIPITWFNLENENCRNVAFNYRNMQPLWSSENLDKKNRYHHKFIY